MKTTPKESCYTGQTRGPEASHHNYTYIFCGSDMDIMILCSRCGDMFVVKQVTQTPRSGD